MRLKLLILALFPILVSGQFDNTLGSGKSGFGKFGTGKGFEIQKQASLLKFGHGSFDQSIDVYSEYGGNVYEIIESDISDSTLHITYGDNSTAVVYFFTSSTNTKSNLTAGLEYTLEVYIKANSGASVTLKMHDGNSTATISSITADDNWHLYTKDFTCGGTVSQVRIYVGNFSEGEEIWVDEINIYRK